jgi:hypothetical protein
MGLFDIFNRNKAELIEWQNVVCADKAECLFMSTKQLEDATIIAVENDMRIFDDCVKLINSTKKPSVFFPRLSLAEEKLNHLAVLQPYMFRVKRITVNQLPTKLLQEFLENKERYVCDFLYSYYWSVKDKAETLKTEKGKQKQYQKFYESLEPYFDQISERNMKYLDAMRNQKI